ncbi:MAG TPA: GDSL-type esterase/lipase family protein [Parafilimonas sp.]|nr:GDSL-type esterase/lipase family protein [Parafilimonas sp.]
MNWYEQDIQKLEKKSRKLEYEPEMIFYGSSSITMWENLYDDFAEYKPVNLGFGGSTLEACVYYFERVMKPFYPDYLVIYAGDNDLGDGKQPKQVLCFFEQLCSKVKNSFGDAMMFYISIKPSLSRWNINEQIKKTNQLIRQSIETDYPQAQFIDLYGNMLNEYGKPNPELFVADGLHLSSAGYALWKDILLKQFSLVIQDK